MADATAFRFEGLEILATDTDKRKSVEIELTPTGNQSYDIYTNSFGGRVPEIACDIISNDVSITVVGFDLALDKVVDTTYNA